MKKTVCVLGASGLLGRYVVSRAIDQGFDVLAAGRDPNRIALAVSRRPRKIVRADICREDDVQAIAECGASTIINCAGLIKPLCTDEAMAKSINTEGPHRLADSCGKAGVRLVHVSTDCVFRGDLGRPYSEDDEPDANDTYGTSKAGGEITTAGHLTVRTSFIGHELDTSFGLLDWFLGQRGEVKGFTRHLWTGLGAVDLADILLRLAADYEQVTGLMQVAGEAIDKMSLLELVRDVYGLDVCILADDSTVVDRRLDASQLVSLGIPVPPMPEMLQRLHDYTL